MCADAPADDSSADDDSSMTDDDTPEQQHDDDFDDAATDEATPLQRLLRSLQQRQLLGGTLLQWMEEHAPAIGLNMTAEQAQHASGLLDQVFVVTKWSDELQPLLSISNTE